MFKKKYSQLLFKTLSIVIVFALASLLFVKLTAKADSHISFNEGQGTTVSDSEGTAVGTITNALWKQEGDCTSGACLLFDGTGDYVSFGDDANFDFAAATNFTIEFWFRTPDITTGTRTFVAKYLSTTGTDGGYKVYMSNDGKVNFAVDDDNTWGPDDIVTSVNAYDDSQWHHLVATKTGTNNLTLYVDAYRVNQDVVISAIGTLANTDALYIGTDGDGTSNGYLGFIDELKIFTTTARSETQVKSDYQKDSSTSGTSARFGPDDSNLTSGLVGYWKMDENTGTNVADFSGNANTGTAGGSPTWAAGKFGSAVSYSSNDYVTVADNATLNFGATDSFTIAAWIRRTGNTAFSNPQAIVDKMNSYSSGYSLLADGDAANQCNLAANTNDGSFCLVISDGTDVYTMWTDNTYTADSVWYHVVAVLDRTSESNSKIYVNGVSKPLSRNGTFSAVGSLTGDTNPTCLGSTSTVNCSTNGINGFVGQIDETRIYRRVLTPTEISQLYNLAPGPVGYWKFDGDSSTVTDHSGNGLNLTNSNNTSYVSGKYGNAVNLINANTNYLSVADTAALSLTGDLTVEGWINPTSVTSTNVYSIAGKWDANESYLLAQAGDEIRFYINSEDNYVTTNAANLSTGQWYHTSAVYNAAAQTIQIYVNGVLQTSTTTGTIPTSINDNSSAFYVGRNRITASGIIDTYINGAAKDTEMTGTTFSTTSTQPAMGKNSGSVREASYLFDSGITGLSGATIDTAYLRLYSVSILAAPGGNMRVSAVDESSPAAPTNSTEWNTDMSLRTSAYSTDWLIPNAGGYTSSPSLISVIQELADSYNPSAILVYVTSEPSSGTQATRVYQYDLGSQYAANLYVAHHTIGTYDGKIDDVKVYNYARTPTQIVEDMNAGHPAPGSPVGSALGYWNFDEGYGTTVHDKGTGGKNGTINANVAWSNSGKFGKAVLLNGAGIDTAASHVVLPNDSYDTLTQGTISIWFKPSDTGDDIQELFSVTNGSLTFDNAIEINYVRSTNSIQIWQFFSSTTQLQSDTVVPGSQTDWHHLVITIDSSGNRVYIDGQIKPSTYTYGTAATSYFFSSVSTGTTHYSFGCGYDASGCYDGELFEGYLDEVKLYNFALNADQIKAEYNHGASQVLGSLSTTSAGAPDDSASREFCVPGDTTSCSPPGIHFPLDEGTGTTTVYDRSGNAIDGTMSGFSSTDWVAGKTGSALSFDGVDNYIADDNVADTLASSSFTISLWFKTSYSGAGAPEILAFNTSACNNRLLLYVNSGGSLSTNNSLGTFTGAHTVNNGTWHHLVVEFDDPNNVIYVIVDAEVDISFSHTESITATDLFSIGQEYDGAGPCTTSNFFDGQIDEVRIYNYIRQTPQIIWDYNRGAPKIRYKMDECTGSTLYNTAFTATGSGTFYNGTISAGNTSGSNDSVGTCGSGVSTEMWNNGTTGKFNSALDFDGTNDSVDLGDLTFLEGISQATWSFWAKPATLGTSRSFIGKGVLSPSLNFAWSISSANVTDSRITVAIPTTTSDAGTYGTTDAGSLAADTWIHIVAVFDGTKSPNVNRLKIYLNGTNANVTYSGTIPATLIATSNNASMGTLSDGLLAYDGIIDDLQIFNYALTPTQVKSLYSGGSAVRF